jgi:hypothetical protein
MESTLFRPQQSANSVGKIHRFVAWVGPKAIAM